MPIRHLLATSALVLAAFAPHAQAASLSADSQWVPFDIDELSALSGGLGWIDLSSGAALSFSFHIAAGYQGTLTVVDGGFAGDRFRLTDGQAVLGDTGQPATSYPDSIALDFDAALADARYSSASFTLGAGSHAVSGYLLQSVMVEGAALNATVGAVRLSVSAVPEPATLASLLAGLSLLTLVLRRRGHSGNSK
jgi:hypothetical protein